jgi:NAD-dependent deacetylase
MSAALPDPARRFAAHVAANATAATPLVVLTGAGLSAESGIPTFRGPDGYWTSGSENFTPQQLATLSFFRERPDTTLAWYMHRLALYGGCAPNAAHDALARLDRGLDGAMQLVTQNVDGLHRRAGHADQRMWCIHGDLQLARCADDACPGAHAPAPWPWTAAERAAGWPTDPAAAARILARLRCTRCRGVLRPHVLWFDEYYDEERYRFDSSLEVVTRATALLVVGTSGATNLPIHMVATAQRRRIPVLVVDPSETEFANAAAAAAATNPDRGGWWHANAGTTVPDLVDAVLAMRSDTAAN